jgi:glutamate--cysteine ligase
VTTSALPDASPSLDALRRDIEARLGLSSSMRSRPLRIGAEIEFLVSDASTRRPAPIRAADGRRATLPVIRELASRHGWRERPTPCGAPAFELPQGGELSFEPGGQLEYAAPPIDSATALVADLRRVATLLRETLGDRGLLVGDVGIDPANPLDDALLCLSAVPRYRNMDAYFARIGPAGATMMRQTASLQLSLDGGANPVEVWRLLSAVAPYALALFANSSTYAAAVTGHQSYRASMWRRLDPARTGIVAREGSPDEYLSFALDAPAMLLGPIGARYEPFREWLGRGEVTSDDWHTHLTTLFPEVRPRGHFEVRSCDAIPARWYAAPIVLFTGLTYDERSRRDAFDALSTHDDPTLLERAGTCGVHDVAIRGVALELFEIALSGCRRLGPRVCASELLDEARDFLTQYARAGRSLADDQR